MRLRLVSSSSAFSAVGFGDFSVDCACALSAPARIGEAAAVAAAAGAAAAELSMAARKSSRRKARRPK